MFVKYAISMIALFDIFLSFYFINDFPFVFIYILTQITENDNFILIMTSCLLFMNTFALTITDDNLYNFLKYIYCIVVLFRLTYDES